MRKGSGFLLSLSLIILLTAAIGVFAPFPPPQRAAASHVLTLDTPQPTPKGTPQTPVGIPAIKPTSEKIPSFTETDVKQYVASNAMPMETTGSQNNTITTITFMTAGEVSKRLDDEDIGVSADTLLCYVELQGTFTFAGPDSKQTATYKTGFEVFDAQSGNLLLSGGLE